MSPSVMLAPSSPSITILGWQTAFGISGTFVWSETVIEFRHLVWRVGVMVWGLGCGVAG